MNYIDTSMVENKYSINMVNRSRAPLRRLRERAVSFSNQENLDPNFPISKSLPKDNETAAQDAPTFGNWKNDHLLAKKPSHSLENKSTRDSSRSRQKPMFPRNNKVIKKFISR